MVEIFTQNNMGFLIQIVLTLLLAVAFISNFIIKRQEGKDSIGSGANFGWLFLLGFMFLSFAYATYLFENPLMEVLSMGILFLFSVVFVKIFLEELKNTDSKNYLISWINPLIKESSILLSIAIVTLILLLILFSYRFFS